MNYMNHLYNRYNWGAVLYTENSIESDLFADIKFSDGRKLLLFSIKADEGQHFHIKTEEECEGKGEKSENKTKGTTGKTEENIESKVEETTQNKVVE